jgi:hypothetical protein
MDPTTVPVGGQKATVNGQSIQDNPSKQVVTMVGEPGSPGISPHI